MTTYTGIICKGLGKGAFFIPKYQEKIKEKLGWSPYPGTLNITLDAEQKKLYTKEKEAIVKQKKYYIPAFQQFGAVTLFPIIIIGLERAAIIIPEKTTHEHHIVEIISDKNICNALKKKEGDTITFIITE